MAHFVGKKILVVEGNQELCAKTESFLKNLGYVASSSHTVDGLEEQLSQSRPDFLILDRFIDQHGFSIISKIRASEKFRALPILIIGSDHQFCEKISALSMGADGFLQKPIQFEVLDVKLQSIFRRSQSYQPIIEDIFFKNVKLSPLTGEVSLDSEKVCFTTTEYKLLEALILEKGRPVCREALSHKSLSSKSSCMRTIDVHINSIREKLGPIGRHIKTLRGKGYMLVD